MFEEYGYGRIDSGEDTLPIKAWKLNNQLPISDDEILVRVEKVHIERNSLKQIKSSVGNDENKIKEQIMGIVRDRGKLHNPFTTTGGTIYGVVEKVGKKCDKDVKAGDTVLVTTSATMIPLFLKSIQSIDLVYGIMEVEGYCVLFNRYNFVKPQIKEAVEPMLLGFEESPALFHACELAKGKEKILITGNNLLVALLYALAAKKANDNHCTITGILYPDIDVRSEQKELRRYFERFFEEIHIIEKEDVLKYGNLIINEREERFDFCINCSDSSGNEILEVLAVKERGCLLYTNVMSTFQSALFFSEGICKDIRIVGPIGYIDGYESFTAAFMEEVGSVITNFVEYLRSLEKRGNQKYMQQQKEMEKKMQLEISNVHDFVYVSEKMSDMIQSVVNIARYDCSVMICGETGVGKEKIAKLIHSLSNRKLGPCVSVNCGAIPDNLMEMEFFGYEKGSFTGANQSGKKGYFEIASNGILFLDEISEMSLVMQTKLLRVLQEKEFYRIGGTTPLHTNARIIATSNRDLKEMVSRGEFREDLYYRLNVASVEVPPLRERKDDIFPIADFFIEKYNEKYDMNKVIASRSIDMLGQYDWPGNVRELENMIQYLMINSESDVITAVDVVRAMKRGENQDIQASHSRNTDLALERPYDNEADIYVSQSFDEYIAKKEKEFLKYNLEKYGTTRKTAEMLGMTQSTIMRKKKKYGL